MSRQNRVTPFGDIIATPARGTRMGNRGVLHNKQREIIRSYRNLAWIICVLQFKEQKLAIMEPGRYTQLFFLDEATAFAAGHRPCAYCQRPRFNAFRQAWASANPLLAGSSKPLAGIIDNALHQERIDSGRQKVTYTTNISSLPDGVILTLMAGGNPYLLWHNQLWQWSPDGYGRPIARPQQAEVIILTPQSVVNTFMAGFKPATHPTIPYV